MDNAKRSFYALVGSVSTTGFALFAGPATTIAWTVTLAAMTLIHALAGGYVHISFGKKE